MWTTLSHLSVSLNKNKKKKNKWVSSQLHLVCSDFYCGGCQTQMRYKARIIQNVYDALVELQRKYTAVESNWEHFLKCIQGYLTSRIPKKVNQCIRINNLIMSQKTFTNRSWRYFYLSSVLSVLNNCGCCKTTFPSTTVKTVYSNNHHKVLTCSRLQLLCRGLKKNQKTADCQCDKTVESDTSWTFSKRWIFHLNST